MSKVTDNLRQKKCPLLAGGWGDDFRPPLTRGLSSVCETGGETRILPHLLRLSSLPPALCATSLVRGRLWCGASQGSAAPPHGYMAPLAYIPLYFRRVARPPRMCRCALFSSSSAFTCSHSGRLYSGERGFSGEFLIIKRLFCKRKQTYFAAAIWARTPLMSSMVSRLMATPS